MEANEKIMNKINALLEKTTENGCTPAEAAEAAAMVQKLLAKHHLELTEQREVAEDVLGCVEIMKHEWEARLANVLAENGCCQVVLHRIGGEKKLSFMGRETDLNAVLALYDTFSDAIRKGIRKEQARCREEYGTAAGAEKSYAYGFISAVDEEMGRQCRALMLVTPQDVTDKMHELFPNLRTRKVRRVSLNADSYGRGRIDGKQAAGRREIAS